MLDAFHSLTDENGIGIAKRPYLHITILKINLEQMRGIRHVFDPNGIMNPGKVF